VNLCLPKVQSQVHEDSGNGQEFYDANLLCLGSSSLSMSKAPVDLSIGALYLSIKARYQWIGVPNDLIRKVLTPQSPCTRVCMSVGTHERSPSMIYLPSRIGVDSGLFHVGLYNPVVLVRMRHRLLSAVMNRVEPSSPKQQLLVRSPVLIRPSKTPVLLKM